ncbi:hypothetical protein [Cognatiluteimonas profundi]|uniref:hypothetical protein n=1 Tax=Cognatiluteimonas profundi TaxID=2594501 RepID=UPI00131E395C|nr:hypothetical protein [Lysobacter profundi]
MERQQIEETLALLQAQCAVQHLMLRAMLRLQPDPMALLEAWHAVRADAERATSVLPADARHSRWLADQMQCFVEDWTAELADVAAMNTEPARHAPQARPRQRRPPSRATRPKTNADRGPSS